MDIEMSIDSDWRGRSTARRIDGVIAALAERQHGVVSRAQLLALGLSRDAIDRRVARRWLHVLHAGVYAVGHRALSMRGRWMAATLAGGPGAVLSHRPAAALWGVRRSTAIEITTPRRCRRPGVRTHEAVLPDDEITTRAGIPVTTITRTIFDLAAIERRDQIEAAVNQAEYHELKDTLSLAALAARYPGRRGSAVIRRLIAEHRIGTTMSRSDLERAFLSFLDAAGLPRPDRTNTHIEAGGRLHECDAVWHSQRLIVELDGPGHRTTKAFHDDRRDDRALAVVGWTVIRVTGRDLLLDRRQLAADLWDLLSVVA